MIACIATSQLLQKALTYFTILSAGYVLSPGQFLALLSAGVLLGSIRTSLSHAAMASSHGRWSIHLFTRCSQPPGFLVSRADPGRA